MSELQKIIPRATSPLPKEPRCAEGPSVKTMLCGVSHQRRRRQRIRDRSHTADLRVALPNHVPHISRDEGNQEFVIHPDDRAVAVVGAICSVKAHWPPAIAPLSEWDKVRGEQWFPRVDESPYRSQRIVGWYVSVENQLVMARTVDLVKQLKASKQVGAKQRRKLNTKLSLQLYDVVIDQRGWKHAPRDPALVVNVAIEHFGWNASAAVNGSDAHVWSVNLGERLKDGSNVRDVFGERHD